MSNAITYRANFGIPGDISRASQPTIEPQAYSTSLTFPGYGLPGKLASGLFVPIASSSDVVYGFLARPYPFQENTWPTNGFGVSTPPTVGGAAGVMRRGYMSVKCNAGTPAAGGLVYVRYANGVTATPVGGIEAASVGGSTLSIPNCQFMGPADASGNVEIFFDNPGNPAAI